jgi:hypothetical protein
MYILEINMYMVLSTDSLIGSPLLHEESDIRRDEKSDSVKALCTKMILENVSSEMYIKKSVVAHYSMCVSIFLLDLQ